MHSFDKVKSLQLISNSIKVERQKAKMKFVTIRMKVPIISAKNSLHV